MESHIDKKFYVPDISEFHLGFEFEALHSNDWFFQESGSGWVKFTRDSYNCFLMPLGMISSAIEEGWIKVKSLDREDIESLGFIKWPDDDIYDLGEFQLHLGRHNDPYKVEIYDENDQYCFVGVIKNKSELKNILKMIGYE